MVVKHGENRERHANVFEYGVILNGSQTRAPVCRPRVLFEYGVILNGSQTKKGRGKPQRRFEYGVILNGSQTSFSNKE